MALNVNPPHETLSRPSFGQLHRWESFHRRFYIGGSLYHCSIGTLQMQRERMDRVWPMPPYWRSTMVADRWMDAVFYYRDDMRAKIHGKQALTEAISELRGLTRDDPDEWDEDDVRTSIESVRFRANRFGNRTSQDITRRVLEPIMSAVNLAVCAHCEDLFDAGDGTYSDSAEGDVCESCAEEHYGTTDGYFVHEDAEVTEVFTTASEFHRDEPSRYWSEPPDYSQLAEEYWERCTTNILSGAAMDAGLFLTDDGWASEPDEADEDPDEYGIFPYHGHPQRNSSWFFVEPEDSSPTRPAIGLEIEGIFGDPWEVPRAFDGDGFSVMCERDGSLGDREGGIEIITRPKMPDWWLTAADRFYACMEAGEHESTPQCGTHATIRRSQLSPLQEFRLLKFLSSEANRAFVRAMAGRATIYSPHLDIGGFPASGKAQQLGGLTSIYDPVKGCHKRRLAGAGRHSPINLKGQLAEWRLFAGVQDAESIRHVVRFLWSLVLWTRPKEATGASTAVSDYLTWLVKRDEFSELYAHTQRHQHTLDDGLIVRKTW